MTKEEIRERINQRRFKRSSVRLVDGAEIEVPRGDHVYSHPTGRTRLVHLNRGGTKTVNVALVTALQTTETA